MTASCYACGAVPAAGASAYCPACTPEPSCCGQVRGSGCHCGLCHATFSHQDAGYTRRPAVACRPPAALGLIQDGRGTWCTSAGLAARESDATRLAAARQRSARGEAA